MAGDVFPPGKLLESAVVRQMPRRRPSNLATIITTCALLMMPASAEMQKIQNVLDVIRLATMDEQIGFAAFVVKQDKFHHLRHAHETEEKKALDELVAGLKAFEARQRDWDSILGFADEFAVEAGCPLDGWPHVCTILWKTDHDGERKRYGEGWAEIPTAKEVESWAMAQLGGKGRGKTRSGIDFRR